MFKLKFVGFFAILLSLRVHAAPIEVDLSSSDWQSKTLYANKGERISLDFEKMVVDADVERRAGFASSLSQKEIQMRQIAEGDTGMKAQTSPDTSNVQMTIGRAARD